MDATLWLSLSQSTSSSSDVAVPGDDGRAVAVPAGHSWLPHGVALSTRAKGALLRPGDQVVVVAPWVDTDRDALLQQGRLLRSSADQRAAGVHRARQFHELTAVVPRGLARSS